MVINSDKMLGTTEKFIEAMPKLYEDTFQPAAKETGKTLSLIPRAINAALVPLQQWIANKEYNLAETEKLLAKKLEHIGEDKIVSPEAYVAVPAIQAISYTMNNAELRNLYANLLARSMNIETKDKIHPSYVEIIKQLSPLDAQIFKIIMERASMPMVNIISEDRNKLYIPLYNNITDITIASIHEVSISVDNLERLKLISIPYDGYYSEESIYNGILNSQNFLLIKQSYKPHKDGYSFGYNKKQIEKTDLGKSFYLTCVVDL